MEVSGHFEESASLRWMRGEEPHDASPQVCRTKISVRRTYILGSLRGIASQSMRTEAQSSNRIWHHICDVVERCTEAPSVQSEDES